MSKCPEDGKCSKSNCNKIKRQREVVSERGREGGREGRTEKEREREKKVSWEYITD